ncbi:MAG: hypothetical protein JWN86_2591 [Planctomycetota bacterium]|nr:hypothetical protein [Planctomycetota bacterium]
MIRVVLVGWQDEDWRLFRQAQWMAQIRETPAVASRPRIHFDIEEDAYKTAIRDWDTFGSRASRQAALEALGRHGAVEVRRP